MNTLDDLTSALDAYADRGHPQGPDAVWASASTPEPGAAATVGTPRRTDRRALVLASVAAAAVLIVGILFVVQRSDRSLDVSTDPGEDGNHTDPVVPAPIVIPDGRIARVDAAFGRIWVTSAVDAVASMSRLRSYDPATAQQLSEVVLPGRVIDAAATDRWLWVRTEQEEWTSTDPATGVPATGTLVRIDPATGTTTDTRPLFGMGPVAAHGTRLAASDGVHIEIIDDDAGVIASTPIADAMGSGFRASVFGPAVSTWGFFDLAMDADGLYGFDLTSTTLVQMDPLTGVNLATQPIDFGGSLYPHLAVSTDRLWFGGAQFVMGQHLPLGAAASPPDTWFRVNHDVVDLVPWEDGAIVAVTRAGAYAVHGGPGYERSFTALDPALETAGLELDGRPWAAQWTLDRSGATTTIGFTAVATGPTGPAPGDTTDGSVPVTPPPSTAPTTTDPDAPAGVLGIVADGPLVDGSVHMVTIAGLPNVRATFSVCLEDDPSESNPCWHAVEPDPSPTVEIGTMGELAASWTAQRSFYDDRWHDCAVERCVLRLYPVDERGVRDTSTVLAETPLVFSSDGPPIRPTLTVEPAGPIEVGSTVTITGANFPPGGRGISIGLCRTGEHDGSCYFDLRSMDRPVDADGQLSATFTVARGTVGSPAVDPVGSPEVDCTAAPGSCSFSIFPMDGSKEPYASIPVEIRRAGS